MSGVEAIAILGVISSIISIIDGTKQVYDAATNAEGLPEAFRKVAGRIPIVTNILDASRRHIKEGDVHEDSCKGVKDVVWACQEKATKLDGLFQKVIPGDSASRRQRYVSAVKTLGKGDEVEKLMRGILEDVQLLACERGMKIATKVQQEQIAKAIAEVSTDPLSVPENEASFTAYCSGSGTQYNAHGEYIAQGNARQYNSAGGSMHFDQRVMYTNNISVLSELRTADAAAFDSHAEEHNVLCHSNTRVKLRHQIEDWANSPCSECIFWLNGVAGTGKSTISRTIAKGFQDQGVLGASFFFKRGERDRGHAGLFFTTIASQLSSKIPALAPYLRDAISADRALPKKALGEQFQRLVLYPLSQVHAKNSLIVVVVDALDECDKDKDIRTIIHLLSQAKSLHSVRLKIFITSRPELPIRLGFTSIRGIYKDVALERIEESVTAHDISVFLSCELARIRKEYNSQAPDELQLASDWPSKHIISILVQMAVPLFIFAATVCRFVEDLVRLDLLIVGRTGLQRSCLIEEFREVVGPIVLLAEPLSMSSLATLLNIPLPTIVGRLSSLYSVLDVPSKTNSPIGMFHLSFRDFLVDPAKSTTNEFSVNQKKCHERLAKRCLELMSSGYLKRDICKLKMPGKIRTEVAAETIDACLPAHVQYACLYWVYHLNESGGIINDGDQAHSFLERHFLHWLEALGLLGRLAESIVIIHNLLAIVAATTSTKVSRFLHDAKRFILNYYSIANSSPLQLYCSALIFAPKGSIVRNAFQNCIPGWIRQLPEVESGWNAAQQTLEGHSGRVDSIAFSNDSKLLASASSDETVKIWDTSSGSLQQTLEGHSSYVNSVAFSNDSKLLASASSDKTVKIWDTGSGSLQQTLEGHSSFVNSVAFSNDSKLLASASSDKTVKIWDTSSGSLQQTLKGHSNSVDSVAFSHNSKLLASASSDKTVKIWNASRGSLQQTLEGHSGSVDSVTFSHDSKLLASASSDKTVKIWDTSSGSLQQMFEGHSGRVCSVTFSHDSKLLASASRDKTVKIWDTSSGSLQQTFKGHSGRVCSVAFSHDSKLLASASRDKTVKIWDTSSGSLQQMFKGHSSRVDYVAFSDDLKLLASASDDKTVKIWDTSSGSLQQTLEGHSGSVYYVAFSEDSKRLVSASRDNTVKIWDTSSGALRSSMFETTESRLFTNIGRTKLATLSNSSKDESNKSSYEILGSSESWVTWNGQNFLWLPPDYRASSFVVSPSLSTIAIGCQSGKVIVIGFSLILLHVTLR